jgi:hypothetical protein
MYAQRLHFKKRKTDALDADADHSHQQSTKNKDPKQLTPTRIQHHNQREEDR